MKLKRAATSLFLTSLLIAMQYTSASTATAPTVVAPVQTAQQSQRPKKVADSAAATTAAATQQPTEKPDVSIIKTKTVSGKTEIPLCATLPLTGETSIIGKNIADGMNLFFNKQRQEKKKPHILSKLYTKDNQSTIQTMLSDVDELQKKSPLFISLTGNSVIATLLPKIDATNVLGLFPIDGTTIYRTPEYKNLIFFRPSHEAEIEALIKYSTTNLNKYKIALFYEASEWGEDCRKALKKIVTKYNASLVAESFYPQDTLNITKAAQDIAISAPNAILCVAQARAAYNFIHQIINKGLHKTSFLCLSTLSPIQQTLWKARGVHIITSSVVPDPVKSRLPIAKEFRRDLQKFLPNKKPSAFLFEGYINAALISEMLKLTKLPISIEGIRSAIENIGTVNFKGLKLSFDRNTRTLSNDVWINTGHEVTEWFLLKDIKKTHKKKGAKKQ